MCLSRLTQSSDHCKRKYNTNTPQGKLVYKESYSKESKSHHFYTNINIKHVYVYIAVDTKLNYPGTCH